MSTQTKKVAFHTLGCKLNFSETSSISRGFITHGYEKVGIREFADIFLRLAFKLVFSIIKLYIKILVFYNKICN